ncbi:MAG: hypothetical protein ABR571_06280 [Jatrophihabitans sp.]|uniref:hypothetical protein n=1 Tax=Jatrophihabitans sp. TaxID=1932789 RepID=UPI00390F63F5
MSDTPESEDAGREAAAKGPVDAGTADSTDSAEGGAAADEVDAAAPHPATPETATAEPSSPEVGRALAELGNLSGLDLADHPDAYQRIHVELQNALASIDDA